MNVIWEHCTGSDGTHDNVRLNIILECFVLGSHGEVVKVTRLLY